MSSLTKIFSPLVIRTARPVPTNPMASDAMKEGMRNMTCTRPVRNPRPAPNSSMTGIASHADDASVPPHFRNRNPNTTAQTEIVPSIERSMDPMMMMNVTPSATIKAGVEAMAMRAKLRDVKKPGLITVKMTISAHNTSSGAHTTSLSRSIRNSLSNEFVL